MTDKTIPEISPDLQAAIDEHGREIESIMQQDGLSVDYLRRVLHKLDHIRPPDENLTYEIGGQAGMRIDEMTAAYRGATSESYQYVLATTADMLRQLTYPQLIALAHLAFNLSHNNTLGMIEKVNDAIRVVNAINGVAATVVPDATLN